MLPPVNEWPRLFTRTQSALLVDCLVPNEGVGDGISSEQPPGQPQFPLGKGPSRATNLDLIRPSAPPSERVDTAVCKDSASTFG